MVATNYAWNPVFDCITKETDDAAATVAKYTQEPKLYGGLISQRRSGVSSFYHYDATGTTRALTDSSQAVTDTAVYTAFGEKVALTGGTPNAFGFVGHLGYYTNPNTSRPYVRSRQFQPSIARWQSKDPKPGTASSTNPWKYCENEPTMQLDPSGLESYIPGPWVGGVQYPWQGPWTCESSKGQCERETRHALHFGNDYIIMPIRSALKSNKCKFPKIVCVNCANDPTLGPNFGGRYNNGSIIICLEQFPSRRVFEILRHELIHALDDCLYPKDVSCNRLACDEIRACSLSGNCDLYGTWYRQGETREACVRRCALASMNIGTTECQGRSAEEILDMVFWDCYRPWIENVITLPPKLPPDSASFPQ